MRRRGDNLAFADDMLVMSNQKGEIEKAINKTASLQDKYNLRLGLGLTESAQHWYLISIGYSPKWYKSKLLSGQISTPPRWWI